MDENYREVEILLIEDNPGDIDLTIDALSEAKVHNRLSVARDGIEALAFLRKEGEFAEASRPDRILLDWNLPLKHGREVLAEIRSEETLRRIPVCVLTTSDPDQDILNAYSLHANSYITKPVDVDQFTKVVRSIEGVLAERR